MMASWIGLPCVVLPSDACLFYLSIPLLPLHILKVAFDEVCIAILCGLRYPFATLQPRAFTELLPLCAQLLSLLRLEVLLPLLTLSAGMLKRLDMVYSVCPKAASHACRPFLIMLILSVHRTCLSSVSGACAHL